MTESFLILLSQSIIIVRMIAVINIKGHALKVALKRSCKKCKVMGEFFNKNYFLVLRVKGWKFIGRVFSVQWGSK